jgi:hypothetical protein
MMEVHFPGYSGSLQCSGEQLKPTAWELAAKVVYTGGMEWAIKSFEPYKVPETDAIYPILLQQELMPIHIHS